MNNKAPPGSDPGRGLSQAGLFGPPMGSSEPCVARADAIARSKSPDCVRSRRCEPAGSGNQRDRGPASRRSLGSMPGGVMRAGTLLRCCSRDVRRPSGCGHRVVPQGRSAGRRHEAIDGISVAPSRLGVNPPVSRRGKFRRTTVKPLCRNDRLKTRWIRSATTG